MRFLPGEAHWSCPHKFHLGTGVEWMKLHLAEPSALEERDDGDARAHCVWLAFLTEHNHESHGQSGKFVAKRGMSTEPR